MRALTFFTCLVSTWTAGSGGAWAADRDLALREGEKRAFKLGGVAQVAIDDASVVEAVAKGEQLNLTAKHAGNARVLVLLKNEQWVTFKVHVLASDFPAGPVAEALPEEGQPVRLRVGEARAFETPGIAKMPPPSAQTFEAKVNGKVLELRGLEPGRTVLSLELAGGKKLQLAVSVEGERQVRRVDTTAAERLEVMVSGEQLLKAPDVEAVQVDDDEVAEVRIIAADRVVVRGLSEGQTVVNVRRGGRVYSHAVNVTGGGWED